MKINYKSDFELRYRLTDANGEAMGIPSNPWAIWLSVGNPLSGNKKKYVAGYDGETYRNCRVEGDEILVFVDNHEMPEGLLWATFIDYQPNHDFHDGDKRIYTPQATGIELVSDKGDTPTEAEVTVSANYILVKYSAGSGIEIDGNTISLFEGTLAELESHDEDIRCLNEEMSDLTTGNNPALRRSDTTTEGVIGKVVMIGRSPYGDLPVIIIKIIKAYIIEDDNSMWYALPSSSEEAKSNADDVLLGQGDKTELIRAIAAKANISDLNSLLSDFHAFEQTTGAALKTKASKSDLDALDNRVETAENAIGTKASASDVTALANRVTTNERAIGELQTEIGDIETLLSAI